MEVHSQMSKYDFSSTDGRVAEPSSITSAVSSLFFGKSSWMCSWISLGSLGPGESSASRLGQEQRKQGMDCGCLWPVPTGSFLSEAPLCFACPTGQPHLCRREGRRQSESTLPAL